MTVDKPLSESASRSLLNQSDEAAQHQAINVNEPAKQTKHKSPEHAKCLAFFYRYINPWMRLCLVLLILYIYSIFLNFVTYRDAVFQKEVADDPRPPMTHPLYNRDKGTSPWILPDVMFEIIEPSPYPSDEYRSWKAFIDSSPSFWCAFFFLLLVITRSMLRLSEFVGIHIVLYTIQSVLKAFTNYPAASGVDPSCYTSKYLVLGTWVFNNFSLDYCGDQMFSGHTSETLIAMIFVRRLIWDYVGWGFDKTEEEETENYAHIARQSHKVTTRPIDASTHPEGNRDVFFYEVDIFSAPEWVRKHRSRLWIGLVVLRFVMWFWFGLLIYALLHNRQHYSADITVATVVAILLSTNRPCLVFLTRWLYRPNWWNYEKPGWYRPVYLKDPLTPEQVNYEMRLTKVGRGGVI